MKRLVSWTLLSAVLVVTTVGATAHAQTREQSVRKDRVTIGTGGLWIYNDLPKALAEARKTQQPLLVVFR